MNIAVLVQDKLMQGLQRLIGSPRVAHPMAVQSSFLGRGTKADLLGPQRAPAPNSPSAAPRTARPLRVLRVVDRGQTACGAGRLVISGRMADVCAELDRLAACEAALH